MKTSLIVCILAAFVATSSAEPEGCALCREKTQLLFDAGLASEVAEEYWLIENVCKNGDFEVGGCSVGVVTWWSSIANIVYTSEELVAGICHHINHDCDQFKGWDCDTCQADIAAIGDGLNCPGNMGKIKDMLNAQICQDANFNAEQQEICIDFVSTFVPAAFGAISDYTIENAAQTCSNVYGIC